MTLPQGLHYSYGAWPWEFQECGHHSARLGPWSAGCGHIRAGPTASARPPDAANIPGLGAQDYLAESLAKEVLLSVEIAKSYFKEATEQRLRNQESPLESWP